MKRSEIQIPIALMGEPEEILESYRALVVKGTAPRLAEILATRHFPGAWTDTNRINNLPPLEQTCGKWYADKVKAEARAAGINVSDNSHYNATMADTRGGGDPKAWTHVGDGISTYKRRLQEIGGGSEDLGVALDSSRVQDRMAEKKSQYDARQAKKKEQKQRLMEKQAKG